MELIITSITVLCVCFSFMAQSASSTSTYVLLKSSANEQEQGLQLKLPAAIPRKLRLMKLAAGNEVESKKSYVTPKKQEQASPGQLHQGQVEFVDSSKGITKHEGVKSEEASEFLGMDYWPIKKRRPIHNQFVPVTP